MASLTECLDITIDVQWQVKPQTKQEVSLSRVLAHKEIIFKIQIYFSSGSNSFQFMQGALAIRRIFSL